MQQPEAMTPSCSVGDQYTRREILRAVSLASLATSAAPAFCDSESSPQNKQTNVAERCAQGPNWNVAGKVAFVTGGSSGIGLGVVRAFLDAGMNVVFTYRTDAHR